MSGMDNQPVIIVRKKKGGDHGHHGGAWKVAYADFVTAMMAFFLLLWLLNVTTDEQKNGIADYFAPSAVSRSPSGAGGVLGGQTIVADGSQVSNKGVPAVVIGIAPPPTEGTEREAPPSDEEITRRLAEKEDEAFRQAESALQHAIQENPQIADLARHLLVDMTPEGLRIQLVDQDQESMFPTGSAAMTDRARKLMAMIANIANHLPNKLSVSGHTDARPYRTETGYGNWELSTDRANASRRVLIEAGVPAARFRLVSGKADQEPLIAADPLNPSNRRISMVLLRDNPVTPTSAKPPGKQAADSSAR